MRNLGISLIIFGGGLFLLALVGPGFNLLSEFSDYQLVGSAFMVLLGTIMMAVAPRGRSSGL